MLLFSEYDYKAYECDCHKFYRCASNGLWLQCCGPADSNGNLLHFNEELRTCVSPSESSCNEENSICHSSTSTTTTATTTPSTSPTSSTTEQMKCNRADCIPEDCNLHVGPSNLPEVKEFGNCRYVIRYFC